MNCISGFVLLVCLFVQNDRVTWQPGRTGGSLHWQSEVRHRRDANDYDAWLDSNRGIFRAEDIIPRARTRTLRGAISGNATSTLLHEVVHVAMGIRADQGYDWIVEGLAEYYGLELLRRGGAITQRRYRRALQRQTQWANEAEGLCKEESNRATTALAVVILHDLDAEIRRKTGAKFSLDSVVAELAARRSHVTLQSLEDIVSRVVPGSVEIFAADNLPGCNPLASSPEV